MVGRKAKKDTIVVMEGVLLKRTSASPLWQCYFRTHKQTFRKSTGTDDLEKAKLKAYEWYFEVKKQAADGVLLRRINFETLCDNYIKTIIGSAKKQYHTETINRHFKPYFADIADIKLITDGKVLDYIVHRRNKTNNEPTPQTLNRENTVLRQILSYAFAQRWIKKQIKVPFISEAQSKRRRPHFTAQEYKTLCSVAKRRVAEAFNDRQIQHTINNRAMLVDVIRILANTGLRVDELNDMTWKNVDWYNGDINLNRAGKRKSSRKVVMKRGAIDALDFMKWRREEWLREHRKGEELDLNEKIMTLADGTEVKSIKTAFNSLLKACNFNYADIKDKHTLTSLRHTYATLALTKATGRRTPTRALAEQMGTSEKMIQAHYGHDTVEDYRYELRED